MSWAYLAVDHRLERDPKIPAGHLQNTLDSKKRRRHYHGEDGERISAAVLAPGRPWERCLDGETQTGWETREPIAKRMTTMS